MGRASSRTESLKGGAETPERELELALDEIILEAVVPGFAPGASGTPLRGVVMPTPYQLSKGRLSYLCPNVGNVVYRWIQVSCIGGYKTLPYPEIINGDNLRLKSAFSANTTESGCLAKA